MLLVFMNNRDIVFARYEGTSHGRNLFRWRVSRAIVEHYLERKGGRLARHWFN